MQDVYSVATTETKPVINFMLAFSPLFRAAENTNTRVTEKCIDLFLSSVYHKAYHIPLVLGRMHALIWGGKKK